MRGRKGDRQEGAVIEDVVLRRHISVHCDTRQQKCVTSACRGKPNSKY